MGFIDDEQLARRAHALLKSGYGAYLLELLDGRPPGLASAAAIAVVNGTDSARAIPPTADRAISMATLSLVSTSPSDRPATLNSNSSGSELPA